MHAVTTVDAEKSSDSDPIPNSAIRLVTHSAPISQSSADLCCFCVTIWSEIRGMPWNLAIPPRRQVQAEIDISNLRTTCDISLGSPSLAKCANAAFAFRNGYCEIRGMGHGYALPDNRLLG